MSALSKKQIEIINISRSWVGTPFRSGLQVKGVRGGADCITFIKGVYEEYTGEIISDVPVYSVGWFDLSTEEIYFNNIKKYCNYKGDSWEFVRPGNILLFRFRNSHIMKHGGIFVGDGNMVHCYNRNYYKCIEESVSGSPWNRSLAAVFEIPNRKKEG